MNKSDDLQKRGDTPENCPHCGAPLSLWEQVILSVDRVLMCRSCWYRIILDVFDEDGNTDDKAGKKDK